MGYAQAFRLLVAGYKKIKGKMPEGLDLLKIKQEARKKVIEANKVIKVNFDKANNWMKAKPQGLEKLIKKGDVKIGQAPKTTKRKPAVDPKLTQEENIKNIMAENKAAAKRLQEKMNKPEKSLSDKLKDYKGDPDAMREGGLMGYAVGGRIQNLMNTYDMSPSLQNQFANQQDYIDLFDLNSNQFTPTTQSAPASSNTSTPQGILAPNIVKPIIIPGSESDGGGTPPGGPTAGINLDYGYTSPGGTFNLDDIREGTVADEDYTLGMRASDAYSGLKNFVKYNPVINPFASLNIGIDGGKAIHKYGLKVAADIQKAIEDAKAKKVAEIARRRNAASITSDSGPGETTSGTFGSSVNEATGARGSGTGFSDYS